MYFNKLFEKIIKESNLAGDGSVFGPSSISTGPDLQGGAIYNPGDYRIARGRVPVTSRINKKKKSKRK